MPCAPPPPKKTSKAPSKTRGRKWPSPSKLELSSDGDNNSHRVPSEDIDMDDRSEVNGDTAARGPPTTSHDDSASEVVSDLEATQKKKWTKTTLRATVNELHGQLMAVDDDTTPNNLETPLAGQGKQNH